MMLPAQYILCRFQPSASRPSKTDKFPLDCAGNVVTAHDPQHWMDYATARTLADLYGPGHGVGFVYTAAAGYWFLDIDGCRNPDTGEWSALALDMCAMFAGCWIEVSQSGNGLHIVGRGVIPAHGCKNVALGLELYHQGRFMALGYCDQAVGSPEHDATVALAEVVTTYFSPTASDTGETVSWTHGPVAEWRGPTDDDDLIRRACQSRSAAGAFGARACFADLWDATPAALAAAYPDPEGIRQYDASSADAALAQHLAFWTGNNCERMQRLMRRSALVREKYEREDYLPRTILSATSRQTTWCVDKPAAVTVEVVGAHAEGREKTGSSFATIEDQKTLFAGHVYIADVRRIMDKTGALWSHDVYDDWFGEWTFAVGDDGNTKTTKSPWEAFTRCQGYQFPKVHGSAFRPLMAPGSLWDEGSRLLVNTYFPIHTPRKQGDASLFLRHLEILFPEKRDRDIILAYMAAIVQYPGVKFQWCPLIQGTPGNGKSLLSECLTQAIGPDHCHSPKSAELTAKFNDWIENRILITVEDVYVPAHKADVIEALKPMITSGRLEIEGKGMRKMTREVCANFILNSNHKDGIQKTKDDRRFAVFYCAQQTASDIVRDGMDSGYFPSIYQWLRSEGYAIVNDYLREYAIPDELNPATSCHRAPATSSTHEAIISSLGTAEQEVMHAIEQGWPGFRGGWVSSHYLDRLLKDNNLERMVTRSKRRALMESLGYVLHPGLKDGRVNNPVQPDGPGNKPRLYVIRDHAARGLMVPVDIARAYEQAQVDAATVAAPVLAFAAVRQI